MSIGTIAGAALAKAIKKAWRKDRDHIYRLRKPWQMLELRDPVPDYEGRQMTIIDSVIVFHRASESDGATCAPDQIGKSNDFRPGSHAHDIMYDELEAIAKTFGWTLERTRWWADQIFTDLNSRYAGRPFVRIYHEGVRKFGWLAHLYGRVRRMLGCVALAGALAAAVAGCGGCATPVPMFVDGEMEEPELERIDR